MRSLSLIRMLKGTLGLVEDSTYGLWKTESRTILGLEAEQRSSWVLCLPSLPPSPSSQLIAPLWQAWQLLMLSAEMSAGVTVTCSLSPTPAFLLFCLRKGVVNYSSVKYPLSADTIIGI